MEPVSKKTGAYYRKERARKIESEKVVVSKMKPLQSLFMTNANQEDQPHQLSSVLNKTEQTDTNSVQNDEVHKDISGVAIDTKQIKMTRSKKIYEVVSDTEKTDTNSVQNDNVQEDLNGNVIGTNEV